MAFRVTVSLGQGTADAPMLEVSAAWAIAPLVVGCALSILHLLRNLMDEGVTGALWSDITTRE